MSGSCLSKHTIDSYKYFNRDDNSIYQKALQRDYIYYGITQEHQQGSRNRSISEHICKIKVDPKTFFKIRDHEDDAKLREDPDIIKNTCRTIGHTASTEELINNMWSQGSYDFRFDINKVG